MSNQAEVKYQKPKRPCLYCEKKTIDFKRHLLRKHSSEEEVVKLKAMSTPREQREQVDKLMKMGLFHENMKRIKNKEEIIPKRNQSKYEKKLCRNCSGFFSSRTLGRHFRNCTQLSAASKDAPVGIKLSTLTAASVIYRKELHETFRLEVLNRLRTDRPGTICRNDMYIITVGYRIWEKLRERNRPRETMRLLGRLVCQMQDDMNDQTLDLKRSLDRTVFYELEKAVNTLCLVHTVDNREETKHGLKVNIAYALKDAAETLKCVFLVQGDNSGAAMMDGFSVILKLEWANMFRRSIKRLEQNRFEKSRRPAQLPDDDDVDTLSKYIRTEIEKITFSLKSDFQYWDSYRFNRVRAIAVARLTLFNARRGSEACKLRIKDFDDALKGVWVNPDKVERVEDEMEKFLLGTFKLAYVPNKGGTKLVPILIPNDLLAILKKLKEVREEVGVNINNMFLFPCSQNSLEACRGWDMVSEVINKANLNHPGKITAVTNRHRLSTYYSALELSPQVQEAWFKHMGHAKGISENVYQCPPGIMEVTRIGRILHAADNGHCKDNIGRKLSDLEMTKGEPGSCIITKDTVLSTSSGGGEASIRTGMFNFPM